MREILFRGKRLDNGEWVEGYYAAEPYMKNTYNCGYILENEKDLFAKKAWLVDSRTVGQYTGLTDKNGTKVFEGDIVRYNDTIHKVIFCTINGSAFFGITMPERGEIWNFDGITCANKMEVIGNIHDNPELLEVEE